MFNKAINNQKKEKSRKMKKRYNPVYQFKIALEGIKPPIWRRVQVTGTHTLFIGFTRRYSR